MKNKLFFLFMAMVFICCNNRQKKEQTSSTVLPHISNNSQKILSDTNRYSVEINPNTGEVVLPFGSEYLKQIKLPIEWDVKDSTGILTAEQNIFSKISQYYIDINGNSPEYNKDGLEIESTSSIELNRMADFNTSLLRTISKIKYQLPDMGPYKCFYSYNEAKEEPRFYLDSAQNKKEFVYENTPPYYRSTGNLIFYNKADKTAKILNIYAEVSIPFEIEMRLFLIDDKKQIILFKYSGEEIYGSLDEEYRINIQTDGEIKIEPSKKPGI